MSLVVSKKSTYLAQNHCSYSPATFSFSYDHSCFLAPNKSLGLPALNSVSQGVTAGKLLNTLSQTERIYKNFENTHANHFKTAFTISFITG